MGRPRRVAADMHALRIAASIAAIVAAVAQLAQLALALGVCP